MANTTMLALARIVSEGLEDDMNLAYSLVDHVYPALAEADYAILNVRPDLNTSAKVLNCVAGSLQTIDAADLRLLDVPCNVTVAGEVVTEGRGVERMARADLHPLWRTMTRADIVEGYLFDDRTPRQFETYPPASVNAKLRVVVSVPFAAYGTITDATASHLPPTYDTAKVEFALYRLKQRSRNPRFKSEAQGHLQVYNAMLGIKGQRDSAQSPKTDQQDT